MGLDADFLHRHMRTIDEICKQAELQFELTDGKILGFPITKNEWLTYSSATRSWSEWLTYNIWKDSSYSLGLPFYSSNVTLTGYVPCCRLYRVSRSQGTIFDICIAILYVEKEDQHE